MVIKGKKLLNIQTYITYILEITPDFETVCLIQEVMIHTDT